MKISINCRTVIADLTSPAAVYLRLRDRFPRVFLFESSDYHGTGDCRSFVCCDPIAECSIVDGECSMRFGSKSRETFTAAKGTGLNTALSEFMNGIQVCTPAEGLPKGVTPGAFGHICFDAVQYAEQIQFTKQPFPGQGIPAVHFSVFRYIIAFNPLKNEAYVVESVPDNEQAAALSSDEFIRHAFGGPIRTYPFKKVGSEESVLSDSQFLDLVRVCKKHIARGDVFQIVPSRRYMHRFEGDDFQVYRALRSINPSPYLFYCDYGGYRLFGSSPEAQIIITNGEAKIFPIAGTYPRSGDDHADKERAEKLLQDPKENAEHCMLVDLARNDLSRHCSNVHVESFREIQYYSHLIHIVSRVVGTIRPGTSPTQIVCDTFPNGTLSGAPKHRAMQILDENEPHARGQYGGCIGFIGFDGEVVLGILIRSFLSINQTLVYQVGMGVVHDSSPESELEEAHTKIRALRAAIDRASVME